MSNTTSTAIDAAIDILKRVKPTGSPAASRDQWLKQLEEESLKERKQSTINNRAQQPEGNIQTAGLKQKTLSQGNMQIDKRIELNGTEIDLQQAADKTLMGLTHRITSESPECLRETMANRASIHNLGLHAQSDLQNTPKTKAQTISGDQLKTYLQKEQKYFELKQLFSVRITENGLHLWLRDSSVCREMKQQMLHRLREGLRTIGVKLLSLKINGELIWKQQSHQDVVNTATQNDGINIVY